MWESVKMDEEQGEEQEDYCQRSLYCCWIKSLSSLFKNVLFYHKFKILSLKMVRCEQSLFYMFFGGPTEYK